MKSEDLTFPKVPFHCINNIFSIPPLPNTILLYPPHFLLLFLGLHQHCMEVSRLRVKSGVQLLAYSTATAIWDLSCVCDLHHSSWQHAGSLTHWAGPEIEPVSSWILIRSFPLCHKGNYNFIVVFVRSVFSCITFHYAKATFIWGMQYIMHIFQLCHFFNQAKANYSWAMQYIYWAM